MKFVSTFLQAVTALGLYFAIYSVTERYGNMKTAVWLTLFSSLTVYCLSETKTVFERLGVYRARIINLSSGWVAFMLIFLPPTELLGGMEKIMSYILLVSGVTYLYRLWVIADKYYDGLWK